MQDRFDSLDDPLGLPEEEKPQQAPLTVEETNGDGDGQVDGSGLGPKIDPQRDLQRRALRDLIALSSDSAATEAQIEEQYKADAAEAERAYEKSKADVTHRYDALRESVRKKYQASLAEITKQHDTEAAQLAAIDKKNRQRIDHEHDTSTTEVKGKIQQQVWLAESVFEATQIQLRQDQKNSKETLANQNASLDELETRTLNLIQKYGQRIPSDSGPEAAPLAPDADAAAALAAAQATVDKNLAALEHLTVPKLVMGLRWIFLTVFVVVVTALVTQIAKAGMPTSFSTINWQVQSIEIAGGTALGICIVLGVLLKILANKQVKALHVPIRQAIADARAAAEKLATDRAANIEDQLARAVKKRDLEVQTAKDQYAPIITKAVRTRDSAKKAAAAETARQAARIEAQREKAKAAWDAWLAKNGGDLEQRNDRDLATVEQQRAEAKAAVENRYAQQKQELAQHWHDTLAQIQEGLGSGEAGGASHPWSDPFWADWKPPTQFAKAVRFGALQVDLKQITDRFPKQLSLPPTFAVPAVLTFPSHGSLLIETDRTGRMDALRALQMTMTRLLTSLPAGRVRFTLIDPVGLGQNFAGFMHLGDYDEALVGGRIWTEANDIDQRLSDLTEHMETVIQKYLRNEYATIDEYNAQAGELAEPYRYLVVADFPANFTVETIARLSSIAVTGARCGVYVMIVRDTRMPVPPGAHLEDVAAHSVVLARQGDRFVWKDDVFAKFPLELDPPPSEQELNGILHTVGVGAKEAKRVEVPFEIIAPKPAEFWSGNTAKDVAVPVGRMGATRLQFVRLGRGVAQHCLIAGKTGSGKSTLLNAIITNLAMWYEPDQVEMYLIDFKKGVEFKTYATHGLPHARAIAVESDREFGLSVLQRLDAELIRRGDLFRKAGTQDLAGYRQSPGALPMPRTLLIIDEFQEFFSEDDKVAQDAQLLLDRLVRQGRAFGIHVMLGSQTIGGSGGLARTTISNMAVRVALACSEADSQLILGDNNSAARLLSRPGEAIYNDQGGMVEANSPFQIAWLPDAQREIFLDRVTQRVKQVGDGRWGEPIVFEGNAPADITKNKQLMRLLQSPILRKDNAAPVGYVGDPVAIKDPTGIAFRRQSGSNVLIIGQQDEASMAMLQTMMISLAVQQGPQGALFYVLDGTAADSPLAGSLDRIKAALPNEVKMISYKAVDEAINELETEMTRRQGIDGSDFPSIYVVIYGLQRYRSLRKSEESFGGFSMTEEEKKPVPDKQFANLLREGSSVGIHILTWCDTPISVERTLDRGIMREFDNRILFQMSANDSSNLIDSPAANKLGANRALAYSEEQGVMEKFRPYGLPTKEWLAQVKKKLHSDDPKAEKSEKVAAPSA